MKIFRNGLVTGLILQLAIGPVFFFIVNMTLQGTIFNGLMGAFAVTIVDCFYFALSILGIGKLLEQRKGKKLFGAVSSLVLMIFGLIIIWGVIDGGTTTTMAVQSVSLFSSFVSVFLLTITNPMTIVFNSSVFAAKAVEYNYAKKELWIFGFGMAVATFVFVGTSVIIFSIIKGAIPTALIHALNILVGCLLVGYGTVRLAKSVAKQESRIAC